MSIDLSWLTKLSDVDDLRKKSGKMLLARLCETTESLTEVKNLDEALKIVSNDYSQIVSNVKSKYESVTDEEYEEARGSYYQLFGTTSSNSFCYILNILTKEEVSGQDEVTNVLEYKLYNFKEKFAVIDKKFLILLN